MYAKQLHTDGNDDLEHATYCINDQLLWEIMKVMIRGKNYNLFVIQKERNRERIKSTRGKA